VPFSLEPGLDFVVVCVRRKTQSWSTQCHGWHFGLPNQASVLDDRLGQTTRILPVRRRHHDALAAEWQPELLCSGVGQPGHAPGHIGWGGFPSPPESLTAKIRSRRYTILLHQLPASAYYGVQMSRLCRPAALRVSRTKQRRTAPARVPAHPFVQPPPARRVRPAIGQSPWG
jgi:hypothetical protein